LKKIKQFLSNLFLKDLSSKQNIIIFLLKDTMSNLNQQMASELEEILNELTEEKINEMTEDELIEFRRKLNPYGRIIAGSDKKLVFSYTNLQEKYLEKLILTGVIAYLNRMVNEWHCPQDIPCIDVYEYTKDPTLIDSFAKDWKLTDKIREDIEENKKWMAKRVIVKEFLEEMFQYNPDQHIRSAYRPQPKDLARGVVDTPAANLAVSELSAKDMEFREQMLEFDRVQKLISMRDNSKTPADDKIEQLVSKKLVLPEQHYYTMDYSTWSAEDKNLLRNACEMLPPVDTFARFRTYYETNYDKLREAVLHLYCEKPDFDIAICPHDVFNTDDEADDYMKKHNKEVITDMIKATTGVWNFHAPFAKVRESAKFFNENTIVLEEIAKQMENDAKLGSELMKQRVKIQKKKNIEKDGPDAEFFKQWRETNTTLRDMNAYSMTDEERAMLDAPDDSITVPVYRISGTSGKVEKDFFYTKAVAPDMPGAGPSS
jgi:hypothetical protein